MVDDHLGDPIDVSEVLPAERAALLDLLAGLDPSSWGAPTPCPAWSVHELAVHLVHDDLRRLSGDRDGHEGPWIDAASLDELVAGLDAVNERWVATMAPTLSPRLTVELLEWLDAPTRAHLLGLPPDAATGAVLWAGPGPHPNWLDVAREYTERWIHQQQLREAVDRPGLDDATFVAPIVETFARALPVTLPPAPDGNQVVVGVSGTVERSWSLARSADGWRFVDPSDDADASLTLPAEVFWRRAVRAIDRERTQAHAHVTGDARLVAPVLDLRAAIVADEAHG